MKFIFIIYIVTVLGWADWRSLFLVKTVEDLMIVEHQIHNMEETRGRCRYQLKEELFPEACLQEIEHGLAQPMSKSDPAIDLLWKRVQRLCPLRVDSIHSKVKIEELLALRAPKVCYQVLKIRLADLEYLEQKSGTLFENNQFHEETCRTKSQL